mmetsp:Transcript_7435/g.16378  ORF Transcript_7435/g.16378 Transcript_7435/m.16378 type:complete len:249 (-) Transcript_7435:366-1112(-)
MATTTSYSDTASPRSESTRSAADSASSNRLVVPFVVHVSPDADQDLSGGTDPVFDVRCASTLHVGTWMLRKRYGDFENLGLELNKRGLKELQLPCNTQGRTDEEVAALASSLARYSNELLQHSEALYLQALHAFFEVDEHIWNSKCVRLTPSRAARILQRRLHAIRENHGNAAAIHLQAAGRGAIVRRRAAKARLASLDCTTDSQPPAATVAVREPYAGKQPPQISRRLEMSLFFRRCIRSVGCSFCV